MWEIVAYQNVESLAGMFNAIAAVCGAGSFKGSIAMVAFFGFVAALFAYALDPQKLQGWKWLGSTMLIMSILFVPKTTVMISDKTLNEAPRVIDNVPFGLAILAGSSSAVGSAVTELMETAFQSIPSSVGSLPSELTYQKNGLMFGSRMVQHVRQSVFDDPVFRSDFTAFIANCVAPDIATRNLDSNQLEQATDLWSMLSNTNPARFSTLQNGASVDVQPCDAVYRSLDQRMPAQLVRLVSRLGAIAHPTLPLAEAAERIDPEIKIALVRGQLIDAARSSSDAVKQSAVINAYNDGVIMGAQKSNDHSSVMLAMGRASALKQANSMWLNNAKVAEQALPMFRNVIEAFTFGMFPLVILLLLLSGGKEAVAGLKNYAAVIVWIQLWAPLFAILNYMGSIYAQYDLKAAAMINSSSHGIALSNLDALYGTAVSGQAIVGYLMISIPFLAWAALKRMENLGSSMVGGLQKLQSVVDGSTSGTSQGNVTTGSVAFDQMQGMPKLTSPQFSQKQDAMTGDTVTSRVDGERTAVSKLKNSGFGSITVTQKLDESHAESARKDASAAQSEAQSKAIEASSALQKHVGHILSRGHDSRLGATSETRSSSELGDSYSNMEKMAKRVGAASGVASHDVLALSLGLGAMGNGVKKSWDKGTTRTWEKVDAAMSEEDRALVARHVSLTANATSASNTNSKGTTLDDQLAANFGRSMKESKQAEARFSQLQSHAEQVSASVAKGLVFTREVTGDPSASEKFNLINTDENGDIQRERDRLELLQAGVTGPIMPAFSNGARGFSTQDIRNMHEKTEVVGPEGYEAPADHHVDGAAAVRGQAGDLSGPLRAPSAPETQGAPRMPSDPVVPTSANAFKERPVPSQAAVQLSRDAQHEQDRTQRMFGTDHGAPIEGINNGLEFLNDLSKRKPSDVAKSVSDYWGDRANEVKESAKELYDNINSPKGKGNPTSPTPTAAPQQSPGGRKPPAE